MSWLNAMIAAGAVMPLYLDPQDDPMRRRELRRSDPDYLRVSRDLNPPKPKPKSKAVQKRRAKNKAARKARRG